MIIVIRIHGQAEIDTNVEETLKRLHIYRKYACTLMDEKDKIMKGMLHKVENYVAYGDINDETIKELITKRGETLMGKKINEKDVAKIIGEIKKGEWKIKRFFRLCPPVGGFRKSTKLQTPKGILGKHEDINKLVVRML